MQGVIAEHSTRCRAADPAAGRGTVTAPQQQTAAPLSRQEHNRLQAEAYSHPARVQRSLRLLDDEMEHGEYASGAASVVLWQVLRVHFC